MLPVVIKYRSKYLWILVKSFFYSEVCTEYHTLLLIEMRDTCSYVTIVTTIMY